MYTYMSTLKGCPEIDRHLTFRDRLRNNIQDRQLYERTKRRLAAEDWSDMNEYAEAKTDVIANGDEMV